MKKNNDVFNPIDGENCFDKTVTHVKNIPANDEKSTSCTMHGKG